MAMWREFFHGMCDRRLEDHRDNEARLTHQYELRLAEKDQAYQDLRIRLASAEAEVMRMRMVLMPLSSSAGAAYARATEVGKERTLRPLNENKIPATDWPSVLKAEMDKLEAEDVAPGLKEKN